jgi:hypothetical protein
LGFDLASCGKELLLELDVWGMSALEIRKRREMEKTIYLVRCHIKVDLGGTCWARLVTTVIPYCLARKD